MKRIIYTYSGILSLLWAAIIFGLCATPGQFIPSASWLDLLSVDKLVHAGIFFVLASLAIVGAAKRSNKKAVLPACVSACILYGGLLEYMQAACFTNRSADWLDFIANSFGCLAAWACSKKLGNWLRAAERPE